MASITIRRLPESTKRKLKIRAAHHGRSMEQEAREILKADLNEARPRNRPARTGADVVNAIRDIFAPLGGVVLDIPPREPIRDPGIK
jgi:antitoxin FitA